MNISQYESFVERYPEYELLFEHVDGSYRMSEHYRFIPETRWTPTEAQLYARLEFLLATYHSYGSKGFDELDGEILPVVAVAVAKRMKGKKYTKKKPLTESPAFWSELKRRLRKKLFQEPEKHRIKKLKRLAYAEEELRPQGEPLVLPMQIRREKKKTPTISKNEYDLLFSHARAEQKKRQSTIEKARARARARPAFNETKKKLRESLIAIGRVLEERSK